MDLRVFQKRPGPDEIAHNNHRLIAVIRGSKNAWSWSSEDWLYTYRA